MKKNLIVVEEYDPSGSNAIAFHVNVEVSLCPFRSFERPLRESSKRYLTEVGSVGSAILSDLFALNGVNTVYIHPYEVYVILGRAFSWENLRDKVYTILHKHCEDLAEATEVATPIAEDPHERFCRGLQELNAVWG